MSVDVTYYSFSSSRADKYWPQFRSDFPTARQYGLGVTQRQKNDKEKQKIMEDFEKANLEPLELEVQREIFDFFKSRGYFIPYPPHDTWVMSFDDDDYEAKHNAEEQIKYLLNYGCVYPKGVGPNDENRTYMMLRRDAPELEEKYHKIKSQNEEKSRQLAVEVDSRFSYHAPIKLTNDQEIISELLYIPYEKKVTKENILLDLERMDLLYGGVSDEYFEEPKVEWFYLETLIDVFGLESEEGVPNRGQWFSVFRDLNPDKVNEAKKILAKNLHWGTDEAEDGFMEYLRNIKIVIKDLSENQDTIFIRWSGDYGYPKEPRSANEILRERALKHFEEYRDLFDFLK